MSDAYPLGVYDYPILVTPARLQVSIMQDSERSLAKCATIVELTLQLFLHKAAMFLQHLTGFLHYLCRFG